MPRVYVTFLGEPHHDRPISVHPGAPLWPAGEEREFTPDLCRRLGSSNPDDPAGFAELLAGTWNANMRTPRFAVRTEQDAPAPKTRKAAAAASTDEPADPAKE